MVRTAVHKTSRFFTRLFAGGASLSMMGLFAIILFNSLRRYTFGKSLAWGEELPVFIAVYGFLFGAAYAYMQDRHVRFTILLAFLPRHLIGRLYMLLDLIMVGIGGLLALSGWQFVVRRGGMETSALISVAKRLREVTGWDWIVWLGHLYPYQAAMVLGGVMLSIAAILKFLERGMDREWMAGKVEPGTQPAEG